MEKQVVLIGSIDLLHDYYAWCMNKRNVLSCSKADREYYIVDTAWTCFCVIQETATPNIRMVYN